MSLTLMQVKLVTYIFQIVLLSVLLMMEKEGVMVIQEVLYLFRKMEGLNLTQSTISCIMYYFVKGPPRLVLSVGAQDIVTLITRLHSLGSPRLRSRNLS